MSGVEGGGARIESEWLDKKKKRKKNDLVWAGVMCMGEMMMCWMLGGPGGAASKVVVVAPT